jgi:hypothetical protein
MQSRSGLFILLVFCWLLPAAAAGDFVPDPLSVQWYGGNQGTTNRTDKSRNNGDKQSYGPAYRYPQAGWIVLHIEGEPYERGVQHGRLLAPEIVAHLRCFAAIQSPKSPADGWKHTRTLCNALFLRRYEEEYLKEMQGIADGASAAGARFDGRPIDLLDVVALNAWPEIDTLDSALGATPTGLEGLRFDLSPAQVKPAPKPMRCSAFAATGPATKDGKIVFGHITMFGLYPSSFYNVWLDVKPSKGHRVLMQTYPAGIQSGLDYYLNDAGLLVAETTLAQTRFEIKGLTVVSRIRQALQYADSIDKAVEVLKEQNNGLYTNEWLLADIKTNEIAMYELGTYRSKLWRSGKNEWFGGTEGFYWGCNNTKDLQVRLETIASNDGQPGHATFRPSDRDRMWLKLYDRYKGKIDADFGKLAFTMPPLAAYHSVDAKFTTTDLARDLKTWALFGPPLGRTWHPTFEERTRYPEVQPLVGNPWAILHAGAPAAPKDRPVLALDLHDPDRSTSRVNRADVSEEDREQRPARAKLSPRPAWHGTLLPATDADTWLAAGFTAYERVVALEKDLAQASGGKLTKADREKIELALFAHRAGYGLAARARPEKALRDTRSDLRSDEWHRVASGKGVLLLHELRRRMGPEAFAEMMDEFGRQHAGKPAATADFVAHAEKKAGKKLGGFFDLWLDKTGLPQEPQPDRNRTPFSVLSFLQELEQTLIVYGTADEAPTNKEAAEALQQAIRARHSNFTVPIRSDTEVTDDDLKAHHLLLIGRPDCNRVVKRLGTGSIKFGTGSFSICDGPESGKHPTYAHARSAVLAASENPRNARFSSVVIAGLEASATLRAAPYLMEKVHQDAEVVILPYREKARLRVVSTWPAGPAEPTPAKE